jgi:hypothetical protein
MINEIKISNYRCYKNLTIKDLGRINIIVGENGSGKTALLEALMLPGNLPRIAQCVDTFLACIDVRGWDMIKKLKLELRCVVSAACKNDPTLGVPHIWSSKNTSDGEKVPLGHSSFDQVAEYLRSL